MMDHIARIIAAYDMQGAHRTGTDVDDASGNWLADEIRTLGFEPIFERFPFNRIDVEMGALKLNGDIYDGTPIYDGSYTALDGVRGSIGPLGSGVEIAVAQVLPNAVGTLRQRYDAARRDRSYKAMVAVTDDRLVKGGLTLVNADDYTKPFGPPVLQLSSAYMPQIQAAIQRGTPATVIAAVRRARTEVFNVGALVRGDDASLPPLVVMTPRSGWWSCASERGGGIACFLAILRALAEHPPRRDVQFIATTGHELGHLGLDHHLTRHPGLVERAHAWIHLGANFAARDGQTVYQASDQALMDLGIYTLTSREGSWDHITPIGTRPVGEARQIYDGSGHYVSLVGTNSLFHHQDDRWPGAIDLPKTARLSRACTDLVLTLAH